MLALRRPARLMPSYYGWWLLAASVVGMAVGNGIAFSSFGLFVDPLESQFSWVRAEVTLGFSVSMAVSGISAPLIGRLIDRVGPRRVILVGTPLTAASYLLLATTGALWQWYVYLAINAVVRQMIFYIPFQVLVARWFNRSRTRAVSILGAGLWLGAVVIVPVMRVVIDAVEWDGAFVFSGVLITALFLPLALFIVRDQPPPDSEELQPQPDSDDATRGVDARADLTVGEAIRTPMFWVITLAMMTFFYGVVGWMVHAIPYYEFVGISPGLAAGLVSITSAAGIVALLIFGTAVGRLGRVERSGILFGGCLTLSMVVLLLGESGPVVITLFIVFFVLGHAGGPLLEPLLLIRAFGVTHFATILGATFFLETIGLLISPTLAGAIFDATNSYDWALVMFAISSGLSALLFWIASRLPRPVDQRSRSGGEPPAGRPQAAIELGLAPIPAAQHRAPQPLASAD